MFHFIFTWVLLLASVGFSTCFLYLLMQFISLVFIAQTELGIHHQYIRGFVIIRVMRCNPEHNVAGKHLLVTLTD